MKHDTQEQTRRDFFRGAARGAAMTVLAAVAGVLSLRAVRRGETSCTGRGLCRRCASLGGCELPQAIITRNVETEK